MKSIKHLLFGLVTTTLLALPALAADKDHKADKSEPKKGKYALETCVVSDEKLGDMGEPYKFTHEGKEVQLCCKSCKKDFDKNPKKFMKKISDAEKKAGKKAS
jgi:YHS domain-containing protein